MKLILVRHGETIENRRHILQGQTHGKLTPEGISQANRLADYLTTSFHIDVCFTSDLQRAVDTTNHYCFEVSPDEDSKRHSFERKIPGQASRPANSRRLGRHKLS